MQGNVKDEFVKKALEMFQLSEDNLPVILGIKIVGDNPEEINMIKYKLSNELDHKFNATNIQNFIEGIINGFTNFNDDF